MRLGDRRMHPITTERVDVDQQSGFAAPLIHIDPNSPVEQNEPPDRPSTGGSPLGRGVRKP